MWGISDPEEAEQDSPPDLAGLPLAEYYFGPLLWPITASPAQWSAYTKHRRRANTMFRNVFSRPTSPVSDAVAAIEVELGMDDGALRKCVSIMWQEVDQDDGRPRNTDMLVRIYSPAAPKYIDVHIKYHCLSQLYDIEWYYSIGYKAYDHIPTFPIYHNPTTNGPPSNWHTRGGWKPICWGHFDDPDGGYDRRGCRVEKGQVALQEGGALDIYEILFGPILRPRCNDVYAVLEYRRNLVATVRLLLAMVGIDYQVACTDGESDRGSGNYMLEGLTDKWVARGIRRACGFQLSYDLEEERRGRKEREELASEDWDGEPGVSFA